MRRPPPPTIRIRPFRLFVLLAGLTALAALLFVGRASPHGKAIASPPALSPVVVSPSPADPLPWEAGAVVNAENLPPRTTLAAPADRPVPAWVRSDLRIGHLPGYQHRMVKQFIQSGYQVITVNALTHWDRVGPGAAIYPPEEVKRSDAYLRQVVDTIHKGNAKAILYIGPVQVPAFSKPFAAAHPDWMPVNADGKHPDPPNFASIRGGYVDWLCDQLAYVLKTYDADGFWFDGFAPVHLHTFDQATRDAFKAFSGGADIPPQSEWDPVNNEIARKYIDWHDQYFLQVADRLQAAVRKAKSEAVIFANHSGCRTWYYPSHYMGEYPLAYGRAVDVSSIELYWDVPGDALYQQFCYAFMQAVTRGHGATTWVQPSEHGITGVASEVETRLRGLEGPPWGVYPEFVESAGREEYHEIHARDVKARQAWWENSEPLPYVGVVASEQTRRLYGNAALPNYFSHTLGAFRAVFEKHLPVRLLTEQDLEAADLCGVRVLVLPNVVCLSDRAAEVVRRFVRGGGGLVATLETSLAGSDYARRRDFALADLFHARYVRTDPVNLRSEAVSLQLATERHPVTDDPAIRAKQATAWRGGDGPPPDEGPLSLVASCAEVDALEGGAVLATFTPADAGKAGERHPAVIASTFGKGRVVYFPAAVDKAMFFYPDAYQRELLANACRWAGGEVAPPAEVEGPLVLSTTFRRQREPGRVIVHLLNDHSSYGRHSIYQKLAPLPKALQERYGFPNETELNGTWPIREEVIPLHDISVRCRVSAVGRATLQPEGIALPLRRLTDGTLEVTVPKVVMHSMVVFER